VERGELEGGKGEKNSLITLVQAAADLPPAEILRDIEIASHQKSRGTLRRNSTSIPLCVMMRINYRVKLRNISNALCRAEGKQSKAANGGALNNKRLLLRAGKRNSAWVSVIIHRRQPRNHFIRRGMRQRWVSAPPAAFSSIKSMAMRSGEKYCRLASIGGAR